MRFFIAHIVLFFLFLPSVAGQLSESVVKANFILNLAIYVEWEKEDTIDRFQMGVLGGDEIYEALQNRSRQISFKGKEVDVIQFRQVNEIQGVHILYVEQRKNYAIKRIVDIATTNQILMFSDSCNAYEHIMINLLDLDLPGSQFEINKSNLKKANFDVNRVLVYLGGTEEDLRQIYKASEKELTRVQEELEEQMAALEKQREELNQKKREVLKLNEEIGLQKKRLESMIAEADAKQDSLDQKIALLNEQKLKIQEQQADIEEQNNQLLGQRQEIEAGNAFLEQQKEEIENQQQRIKSQQGEIQEQTQTLERQGQEIEDQTVQIEKQRTILYLFLAFFILIAGMIFFILRAYRIKRQANQQLEEKNAAITRQKEEIQAQQEELKTINQKIEKQNENIRSSIHYALTIQQALLPLKEEMDQLFESFVIYRPKDIVSGDFYWMNRTISENGIGEKIFLVVADCTGHGVPGAFLSLIGIKLLSSIINERKEYDPKTILEMLNQGIKKALQQEKMGSDDGMDVCLCRIEKTDEGKIKILYSGARRPLYYTCNQKINILHGDRKTVGGRFLKNQVFTDKELLLNPGDRIFLSTDGIADQNSPSRQKFGSKRLVKLLEESLHLSMSEQKAAFEKALDDFKQNEKQRDDISLMGIKF